MARITAILLVAVVLLIVPACPLPPFPALPGSSLSPTRTSDSTTTGVNSPFSCACPIIPTGGVKVTLAQQTIPASGGTITINKTGDPLNGLQITVPSSAYKTPTNFTVSSKTITSPNPDYPAASPLISIENGGAVSEKPMMLKIPIKYAPDELPMVFELDAATGELEPVPTAALDANSISVEVYHFSDRLVLKANQIKLHDQETRDRVKGIPTSFEPGKDDWNFENKGTYITDGGNCAGMSMTAMWYREEISVKGNAARLNDLYPGKSTQIPEDNREAWRLVSAVQRDYELYPLGPMVTKKGPIVIDTKEHGDRVTYQSFAFAMLITGKPQLVIMEGKDKKTGKEIVGHAMVAYGVKGGLLVADPNDYPRVERIIPYTPGGLGPYDTDPSDKSVGYLYERFAFAGRQSIYPWAKIGERWAQVTDPKLGNDRFPEYNLRVTDDKGKTYDDLNVKDTLTVDSQRVSITIASPANLALSIYRDNRWAKINTQGLPVFENKVTLDLKQDENIVGLYVAGFIGASNEPKWADFKWVTITSTAPPLQVWEGELTGTSKTEMSHAGSGTWSLVEISFDFAVSASFTGTSKGTGSLGGSARVERAILTDYATTHPKYRTATITGSPVSNGEALAFTPPSGAGPGGMSLSVNPGKPAIKFGSHSGDVYTLSDNPNPPIQCAGISLAVEERTATRMSGTWQFLKPSEYVQASSPTYRFVLTREQ